MKQLNKIILPLFILFLSIGLVIGFRSYLLEYLIHPIALLAWGIRRLMLTVDQQLYWLLLVLLCAGMVFLLVPFWNRQKVPPVYRYAYRPPGPFEYWQALIRDRRSTGNGQDQLRSNLKELAITLMTQSERSDPSDVERMISQKIGTLPPAVRDYLFPPGQEDGIFTHNVQKRAWYRKISLKKQPKENIDLDAILKWMESELEIDHDN